MQCMNTNFLECTQILAIRVLMEPETNVYVLWKSSVMIMDKRDSATLCYSTEVQKAENLA